MPHGAHYFSSFAGSIGNGFNGARIGLAALALSAAWSLPGLAFCSETLRTVALSGQPVPQLGAGVTFKSFDTPSISDSLGWTAFSAVLQGVGIGSSNDSALFSEAGGVGLRTIAREGTAPIASKPTLKYRSLNGRRVYAVDAGTTLVQGLLTDGVASLSLTGRALANGEFELIALEGEPAPKGDPSLIVGYTLGLGSPNQLGYATFLAGVGGAGVPPNALGPWIEGPNGLALPAYNGGATPLGPGITISGISGAILNNSGEAVFETRLEGNGITAANESALWLLSDNGMELLVRGGDPAPATVPSQLFKNIGSARLNDLGQVIFQAGLPDNTGGFWTNRGGFDFELVLRDGQHAPGTPAGTVFGYTPTGGTGSLAFNNSGHFAVLGALNGPGVTAANEVGVFSDAGGNGLELIARMGDPAPGTTPSTLFADLKTFEGLAFNELGQLAFRSGLTGPSVNAGNNAGIWAQDVNGALKLIVRTGDLLDVSDDAISPDLRTVAFVDFLDGVESALDNTGQIAFYARFTDGSEGVFVSSAVAVPEPASVVALAFGFAATLVGRRPDSRSMRILSR